MAKLIADDLSGEISVDVPENSPLTDYAEQVGVYFGCQNGNCGVCDVEIVEGIENLTEQTDKEKDFELLFNHRLLCQCKIKHGNVKIRL
ncbi:MAG TPA: 2Fe-2S iron-sulfur cluster-binding protein [Alphaproteobacteria bacterium]|nr:2Fe-2S iron-sulfur cluster-binding protein [Alphaproteobacteria bacterium]